MGGMMDWTKKRCIHNETWGRQIISQKASYAVILILKKGNNFKIPLLHILDKSSHFCKS